MVLRLVKDELCALGDLSKVKITGIVKVSKKLGQQGICTLWRDVTRPSLTGISSLWRPENNCLIIKMMEAKRLVFR